MRSNSRLPEENPDGLSQTQSGSSSRDKLYLLPVHGSDTQWYKNVLENPSIRIDVRGTEKDFRVVPITDPKQVYSIVNKFREKYGAGDVKKYYSKFDVAVQAPL